MMRAFLTILLFFIIGINSLFAQTPHRITGRVIDKNNNAVEAVAVVLSNKETNKIVGTTTVADGSFALKALEGAYTFELSLIGYEKYALEITVDKELNLGDIVLKEDALFLKEIKITANRVEYDMRGYEYRVGSIEALKNRDLTEILNTAPGVMAANKITLYGSPVVNVYINRRKIVMTEEALLEYLRTYKGADLEKIVVISEPDISARHSGISIRIITKKEEGGFFSASVRDLLNKDNHVWGANSNIDYRKGKLSFYASGGYMNQNRKKLEITNNDWKSIKQKISDTTTEKTKISPSFNATLGIGYDISKKDYLSAELSFREIDRDQNRDIITENEAGVAKRFKRYNTVAKDPALSLMYVHTFKDASEFTITGDYVGSYKKNEIIGGNINAVGAKEEDAVIKTENNTSTFIGYALYSKRFGQKQSINAGMKYSYITNEAINNNSSFSYKERLLSPFASYSANLKKFGFRVGLTGNWANIDHYNYSDIVPALSVNYYINRKKGNLLSAGYSMAVHRPSISQLNPNAVFSEKDIIVRIGNPNLKSYYGNNFSLALKLLNSYSLSANYRRANDAITSYIYTDEKGTLYQTYTNNARSQAVSAGFNFNKTLFKKLDLNISATYAYSESYVNGNTTRNNSFSCAFVAFVYLPKSFTFSAEMFANSRKRIGHNAYKKEPVWLDLALAKRVKRWKFKLMVSDLLNSYSRGEKMVIDMGDYIQTVSNRTPSRAYNITVSYNFNWGKAGRGKRAQTQKSEMNSRIGE